MAPNTVRLLQAEPDLGRFLSAEDHAEAERLLVPVISLERGPLDLDDRLRQAGAFGALLLDGMMLQRMRLSNQVTMKLHGPGDVLGRISAPSSMLIFDWAMSVADGTKLALVGNEFLGATRRWPALSAGLYVRMAQQAERLAVQLAICQLPRVDERLLALLWWLAEAWGRVTSVGTVVPVSMTHDVLGALVGARRPTVTLALGELSERGAIVRQDRGWLLLEPPPTPDRTAGTFDDPALIPAGNAVWRSEEPQVKEGGSHVALLDTVHRLRAEHTRRAAEVSERLRELREAREVMSERRRTRPINRRPAPS
jgi:CRP-like cAMP-binding protein